MRWLNYYRLQKMEDRIQIVMEDQPKYGLVRIDHAGFLGGKEEKAKLSEIIEVLNDKFGMHLT